MGAGMAGLAAADCLLAAGRSVCVLEEASVPGGLTRSIDVGGESIEAYYHHAFPQDRELHSMVERLGLRDRFEWRHATTGVLHGGLLYPFDTVRDLLGFRALSLWGRLRLGLGGAVALVAGGRRGVAGARVSRSGPRWFGRRGYEVLWKPLLDGKFGPYSPDVSMAWLAARMRQRAQARKTGKADKLGYLRGGFGVVADALTDDLTKRGAVIEFERPVSVVEPCAAGWIVRSGSRKFVGRAVLACVSSGSLGQMVDLPAAYSARAGAIPYRGVVCALLELDRSISPYYWTNLAQPSPFSTLAVIEHTNFIPPERYGGRHLVYLTHYVDPDTAVWAASAEEIVAAIEPALRAMNPEFNRSWVRAAHVSRDRWAQPVPLAGGSMPGLPMETGLPGLFNASIAHIYPDDRGLSLAIGLGHRAADATVLWLREHDQGGVRA